jgi:GNAT superfamily N-acetyltransferase
MIFEALNAAADAGELFLVNGGMLHFHQRKDGVVTIREIIVLRHRRRQGIGKALVMHALDGAKAAVARCPVDLVTANTFWEAIGFTLVGAEMSKSGRVINTWRWNKS